MMRSFYHSFGLTVLACICFGALFARRLAGDDSIGSCDLTMTFVFMVFAIYMTVDAYKLDIKVERLK